MNNDEMRERLRRLTHEPPEGMYEALHNTAIVKDREVFLRGCADNGGDINLCEYIAKQCAARCKADYFNIPSDEFGEYMDCECPICLLWFIAVGAAEMREKLKRYEDKEAVTCAAAKKNSDGTCNGYQRSKEDDEPCEMCKICPRNEFYESEATEE